MPMATLRILLPQQEPFSRVKTFPTMLMISWSMKRKSVCGMHFFLTVRTEIHYCTSISVESVLQMVNIY
jgi:hypothetical protein